MRANYDVTDGNTIISLHNLEEVKELKEELIGDIAKHEAAAKIVMKALRALALLDGDEDFFLQARKEIIDVWGNGYNEELPLQWKLEDIEADLRTLYRNSKRKTIDADTRMKLTAAIKDKEAQAEDVRQIIEEERQQKLKLHTEL